MSLNFLNSNPIRHISIEQPQTRSKFIISLPNFKFSFNNSFHMFRYELIISPSPDRFINLLKRENCELKNRSIFKTNFRR